MTRAQAACERAQQIYNELVEGTRKEEIAVDRPTYIRRTRPSSVAHPAGLHRAERAFRRSGPGAAGRAGRSGLPGTPIVTLADLDHIWVRVYVPIPNSASALGPVRDVRTDTYPGKIYHGRISFISSEAEFTPKSVQTEKERVTLVYRVKVDVENPELRAEARHAGRCLYRGEVAQARMKWSPAIVVSARANASAKSAPSMDSASMCSREKSLAWSARTAQARRQRCASSPGVLDADWGAAIVAGCDVVRDPEGAKHHLSYMPQRFGLYEDLTVEENIRFYADLFGVTRKKREPRSTELLAAAGLSDFRAPPCGEPLRRDEAEARPGLRPDSHPPCDSARRAHQRRRSGVAARLLGDSLFVAAEGVAILTSTSYLDEAERCHRVGPCTRGACSSATTRA